MNTGVNDILCLGVYIYTAFPENISIREIVRVGRTYLIVKISSYILLISRLVCRGISSFCDNVTYFLTSPTKRFFLSFFERSASISLISFRVLCTRSMLFVRIISSVRQRVRYCISAFFGSLEHILTILVLVRSMEIILPNISFV